MAQVVLAVVAFLYEPCQYRAGPHPPGDNNVAEAMSQLWPPPAQPVVLAMNFPAYAVTVPVH